MKPRKQPQTPEQKLFESVPEDVKRLQEQSKREKRAQDRREFKAKYRP
jgi:hypothetical protein